MKRALLVVVALMAHAPAAAQDLPAAGAVEPPGVPDVPPGYGSTAYGSSAGFAAPGGASAWLSPPPGGPLGMRNPVVTTTADTGLLIGGGVFTLSAYLTAIALSAPFAFQGCNPWARCQPGLAVLSLVPLAHWAGGFSGSWGAAATFIAGGVFSVVELVGLFIILGGAAHHHPALAPQPGSARLIGAPRADAGVGVEVAW